MSKILSNPLLWIGLALFIILIILLVVLSNRKGKIKFDSRGGSALAPIKARPGEFITLPYNPVKKHCTFGGWYEDEACTVRFSGHAMPSAKTITLYAKWIQNEDPQFKENSNRIAREALLSNAHMSKRSKEITSNTIIYVVLIVMSVIWLIPFIFIVLQSFRVETRMQVGYVLPHQWGFDNYAALGETNFWKWYLNTFIIALFVAVLQTIIILCMSYTLSRFRFKLRKPLMNFMLILGMFPGMLTMIILYKVLKDLGLTQANAVPGLILVYVASSGMGYYVSKGFFDTIPKSLDEAARVDGATRAQVLTKVILPLAKPIVIYTVLTAFMGPWGDFVFARYISMNEPAGMNVAVGLYSWLTADQINNKYTLFCAGGVIVAIPVTLLFMFLQKYYVEGVTGGAVKG